MVCSEPKLVQMIIVQSISCCNLHCGSIEVHICIIQKFVNGLY